MAAWLEKPIQWLDGLQPQQAKETVLRHLDSYQKRLEKNDHFLPSSNKITISWHNPVPIFSELSPEKIHEAIQQNSNHPELPVYQLGYAIAI